MVRKVCGLIIASCACAAGAGCVEEPVGPEPVVGPGGHAVGPGADAMLAGAELRTVGAPGAPDLPFGEALITYSRGIGAIHAFEQERADPRIHAAVLQIATILDRMPAGAAQPSLRRAAALIRSELSAVEPDEPAVEHIRRALVIASGALLGLAQGTYAGSPGIAARARAFAGAVEAIDPQRAPPDRAGIVDALVRAERVLASMYAANVRSPRLPASPR